MNCINDCINDARAYWRNYVLSQKLSRACAQQRKFHRNRMIGLGMHKGQTNKHSFLYTSCTSTLVVILFQKSLSFYIKKMEIPLSGSIFQSRHRFWNYIPLLEVTFPTLPIYQKIWRFPFTFNLTLNKSFWKYAISFKKW